MKTIGIVLGVAALLASSDFALADAFCTAQPSSDYRYDGVDEFQYTPKPPPGMSIVGGGCMIGDKGKVAGGGRANLALYASMPVRTGSAVTGWACHVHPAGSKAAPTATVTVFVTLCPVRK